MNYLPEIFLLLNWCRNAHFGTELMIRRNFAQILASN